MARLGLWMDLYERARIEQMRQGQRNMRQIRETVDPFEMPDPQFISTYRLSKSLVRDLVRELEPLMRRRRRRAGDISIETKVGTYLQPFHYNISMYT